MRELSDVVGGDGTWAVIFVDLHRTAAATRRRADVVGRVVDWMGTYALELSHFIALLHARGRAKAVLDTDVQEAGVAMAFVHRGKGAELDATCNDMTLKEWLASKKVDGVLIAGVGTELGVRALVHETLAAGLKTAVLGDLSLGGTARKHAAALREVEAAGALVGVYDPEHLHGARKVTRARAPRDDAAALAKRAPGRLEGGDLDRLWTASVSDDCWIAHRPVAFRGSVIVQAGHLMTALDVAEGTQRWQAIAGRGANLSCKTLMVSDDHVFSTTTETKGEVARVDAASGTVRWRVGVDGRAVALSTGGSADPAGIWVLTERGATASYLRRLDQETGRETGALRGPPGTCGVVAEGEGVVLASGIAGLFAVGTRGAKPKAAPVRPDSATSIRRGMDWIVTSRYASVGARDVVIEAIDPTTFDGVWQCRGQTDNPNAFDVQGGHVVSPGPDTTETRGTVVLRDERSGAKRWESKELEMSIVSVHLAGVVVVVVGSLYESAVLLDLGTGAEVGRLGLDAVMHSCGAIAVDDVLITAAEGTVHAFRIPRRS